MVSEFWTMALFWALRKKESIFSIGPTVFENGIEKSGKAPQPVRGEGLHIIKAPRPVRCEGPHFEKAP